MKEAETPEERYELWREYWLELDPTPGTSDNETKDGYYTKIEYANQNFSLLRREGWRTDRGMILITYGVPDQIEDFPFEINTKAHQVWYYYRSASHVREFLFIDEYGTNDYVLQFPYDGINY